MFHLTRGCFYRFYDNKHQMCFGYLKSVDYEKDVYVFQPLISNIETEYEEFEYPQIEPNDHIEKGLITHYIYTNAKVAPKALIPRNELYFQVEQHSDNEDLQYALNLCNYKYDFDKQILTKIVRIK